MSKSGTDSIDRELYFLLEHLNKDKNAKFLKKSDIDDVLPQLFENIIYQDRNKICAHRRLLVHAWENYISDPKNKEFISVSQSLFLEKSNIRFPTEREVEKFFFFFFFVDYKKKNKLKGN